MSVEHERNVEQDASILSATTKLEGLLGAADAPPTKELARPDETGGEKLERQARAKETPPKGEERSVEAATEPADQASEQSETAETEPAEQASEGDTFEITLPDGSKANVTAEELTGGYFRQADYTRKTQALADERKTFDAERSQAITQVQQQLERLNQFTEFLMATDPAYSEVKGQDLAKMADEEPEKYVRLRARLDQRGEQYRAWQQEREQQMAGLVRNELARQHDLLLKALPEWSNPDKRDQGRVELSGYLTKQGFSNEELSSAIDHRLVVLARKAMLYDRMVAARPAVAKKLVAVPKVQSPGTRSVSERDRVRERVAGRNQRLKETGKLEDAAALFRDML